MLPAHMKNTHDYSFILPDQQTCQRFTLSDIQSATNNFDETQVIGHGGFGKVYKCSNKILSLTQVALKRLNSMSNQGASEFEAEVKVLSKLRHANLVPLIGYCHEKKEMILAYEFMPNGTLQDHLGKVDSGLSWLQRLKICIGAARGLDYLHSGSSTEHGIIHRDMKTTNILLDASFSAKISDFGLARVTPINQTQTYVSTLVKGTFGYMDPCYFYSGKLTKKSDIYAFGVVLFEVLTGKRAVDSTLDEEQWSLAVWAQDQIKKGKLNQIVDYSLTGHISKKCLKEFANIAIQCLDNQPKKRPTMAEIVVKLESILSQERERADSGVGEERFINKVRYYFTGKADSIPFTKAEITGSKTDSIPDPTLGSKTETTGSLRPFTYAELVTATNNFSDKEFSPTSLETVYKGWVDEKTYAPTLTGFGLPMYVRKRRITTGTLEMHFKSEDFNHPNLVKLLGYYLNKHDLSYVYELTPGSRLDKLLFEDRDTTSLSWVARLKIALGTAHGLSFLHQRGHPAYSQFKTTCILVDTDYNARLTDFEVENTIMTIDSNWLRTDAPYGAPEWRRFQEDVMDGLSYGSTHSKGFAVGSEIYSFGVVLLEILTGMKVFDENRSEGQQKLVKWAIRLLERNYNTRPRKRAFRLALIVSECLQPTQEQRPSMKKIIEVLQQCYLEEILTPS